MIPPIYKLVCSREKRPARSLEVTLNIFQGSPPGFGHVNRKDDN